MLNLIVHPPRHPAKHSTTETVARAAVVVVDCPVCVRQTGDVRRWMSVRTDEIISLPRISLVIPENDDYISVITDVPSPQGFFFSDFAVLCSVCLSVSPSLHGCV